MKLEAIDNALKDGCRLHAFCSGGGLHVVRLEKDGNLRGYGEHLYIEDALSHCNEDVLVGTRPYDEVYGVTKPHYITGSSNQTSPLGQWISKGNTFDAWYCEGVVTCQLKGFKQVRVPKDVEERFLNNKTPLLWENRGYHYMITNVSTSEDLCLQMNVVRSPDEKRIGSDPWMYNISKTGHGPTLFDAINEAFQATEVEVV